MNEEQATKLILAIRELTGAITIFGGGIFVVLLFVWFSLPSTPIEVRVKQ